MKKIYILTFFVLATQLVVGQLEQPSIKLINSHASACKVVDSQAIFQYESKNADSLKIVATGAASFLNMSRYKLFDATNNIELTFNAEDILSGIYNAILYVKLKGVAESSIPYSISVEVLPLFNAGSIFTEEDAVCLPLTIDGTLASGGTGSFTYQWRRDDLDTIKWNFPTYTPDTAGTYTRWVRNDKCQKEWEMSEGEITLYPAFSAGAIDVSISPLCFDTIPVEIGSAIDAFGGDENIAYLWKKDGIIIEDSVSHSITVIDTGTYTRWASDGKCQTDSIQSAGVFVIVPAFSAGKIAGMGETICGESQAVINSVENATGGYGSITYNWKRNGGAFLGETDSPVYITTIAGIYTRFAKDTKCSDEWEVSDGSYEVKTIPFPILEKIVAKYNTANNPYILVYPEPGFKYQWYKNNKAIDGANEQYYVLTQVSSGELYSVYVADMENNLCGNFTEDWSVATSKKPEKVMQLLPNPAKDQVKIVFDAETLGTQKGTVYFYNMYGTVVHKQLMDSWELTIVDLNFPSGIYLVKLMTQAGKEYLEKLIIK